METFFVALLPCLAVFILYLLGVGIYLLIGFIKIELEYKKDMKEIHKREHLYGNTFYIDANEENAAS